MKAGNRDFASVLPRAIARVRLFFLCGDDACVEDGARAIAAALPDAGECIQLSGAELRRDPVRLGDEARSTSLFGGSRHIWVSVAGDEAYDAIDNLLAGGIEGCPVIVTASSATDKSRTARFLEKRDDSLVAMFYAPDMRAVAQSIRGISEAKGVHLSDQSAALIARNANMDIRLARSEIDKLVIYLDASPERPRKAGPDELRAICAGIDDDGISEIVNIVLSGRLEDFASEICKIKSSKLNSMTILIFLEKRISFLAALLSRWNRDEAISDFLEKEKSARRIFWKDVPDVALQMRIWKGGSVAKLTRKIMHLHAEMLANSRDSDLIFYQCMCDVIRFSGSLRKK